MTIVDTYVEPSLRAQPVPHRLRVGVILESPAVPRWVHQILDLLDQSTIAELVLIATVKKDEDASIVLPVAPRASLLFKLWRQLDEKVFKARSMRPDVFDVVSFAPVRSRPELLEVQITLVDNRFECDPKDLEAVMRAHLDVLVNLSTVVPKVRLQESVRCGVWSFEEIDDLLLKIVSRMSHPSLPIENCINVAVSNREGRLPCAYLPVDGLSLFRNYSNLCSKRSAMLAQCLDDLRRHDTQYIQDLLQTPAANRGAARGNVETARLLSRMLVRMVKQLIRAILFHEQWFIALRKRAPDEDWTTGGNSLTIVRAPSNHFYADPFVIDRGEKSYVFFEDYSCAQRKGVISFVEIDAAKGCGAPQIVLEEPYHLSYPCIFEWHGETYLLPETKDNKTIQLYRAIDFPWDWELAGVLLRGVAAVDTTILNHKGKFWMFTSGIGSSDSWFDGKSELFLFFSNSLFGPWAPHPRNPIVSDIRRCRPAGHLFLADGHLIRPGQDYSAADSWAVTLNRVDVLTETEYHETSVGTVKPGWMKANLGTHTFNRSKRYEVLDGRTLVGPLSRRNSNLVMETVNLTRPLIELI